MNRQIADQESKKCEMMIGLRLLGYGYLVTAGKLKHDAVIAV